MMRKNLTIFCVCALSLFLVGSAFAEFNANAYFKLDKNIATAGYQEGNANVTGIAANANVGFAVYAQSWDNASAFTVKLEWDVAKAAMRTAASGPDILIEDTVTINGESIAAASETNILGSSISPLADPANTPGNYTISYFMTGGAASTTPGGLVYFANFKTSSTFKTDTTLSVKVSVTVADENGAEKFLGYRFFNVGPVAVENQSWGKVKSQFKSF